MQDTESRYLIFLPPNILINPIFFVKSVKQVHGCTDQQGRKNDNKEYLTLLPQSKIKIKKEQSI